MDASIMQRLGAITEEEAAILAGENSINRNLYMIGDGNTINGQKLLAAGKLITLRTHTRFIHFPQHVHDYVEVVYMCSGETTHIVNGTTIQLQKGELLMMNQRATHEIFRAGKDDVAVNFIILPIFFADILENIGEEETPLRRFLVDCLCGKSETVDYLHFRVSDSIPVQNLVENLLFTLLLDMPNKRKVSQMTMTLLFLQLTGHMDNVVAPNEDATTIIRVYDYVETKYVDGTLSELADMLHYDLYALSREIKRKTGKNFTELMQEKRLAQATFLLKSTGRSIDEIANAVGYENTGYFHQIFKTRFGQSPGRYRKTANQVSF